MWDWAQGRGSCHPRFWAVNVVIVVVDQYRGGSGNLTPVHMEALAIMVVTVTASTAGCRGPVPAGGRGAEADRLLLVMLLLRVRMTLCVVWTRIVAPNRPGAEVQGAADECGFWRERADRIECQGRARVVPKAVVCVRRGDAMLRGLRRF